jgi:hypothetical protein
MLIDVPCRNDSTSSSDVSRDMLFGWQLYFGELDGGGAEGDGTGRDEETGQRGGDMSRVDMDMEYGWRLYFNELPGHGEADAVR